MCGIAGIVARAPIGPDALSAMMARIGHRGPDGEGSWFNPDRTVALGHRRLAVIDPTPAGAQPMTDAAGNAVITFNGEIYNYVEIAARLKAEGVTFRTKSDTEILLAAYSRWGEDCLAELNGMFAFAIYDAAAGKLFCARDRFGEKPFLYCRTGEYFAFASEYKSLLALDGIGANPDVIRLLRFLQAPRQGLDDGRRTIFPDIEQLLPGEQAVLDVRTLEISVRRYWGIEPDSAVARLSEDDAVATFRDLLTDSVRLRLRSDVPVGSCLSGGLDSSAIVCLSRRFLDEGMPYHVFTGRFPGTSADEGPYAQQVIDATGATSHVTEPTPDGFLTDLDEFIWFNELPVGSTSQYAQWCVFREAKANGVTVLLDGQGADELLGGYEQYFTQYLASVPADERAAAERKIRERYPMALDDSMTGWKRRMPHWLKRPLAELTGRGSDPLFGFSADAAARLRTEAAASPPPRFNPLAAALYEDSLHAHLPTLLRYGDRNSMAHSREVRLPFCDHRIAELVLSLPPRYLMGDAQTKRLLRSAMDGILPDGIRTRWNKQGFLPPQDLWFEGPLLAALHETIDSPRFSERGYWNVAWWKKCLRRFEEGERHLAWTLWRPFIAEAWREKFVDRASSLPKTPVLA